MLQDNMMRKIFGNIRLDDPVGFVVGDEGDIVVSLDVFSEPSSVFLRRLSPCQLEMLIEVFIVGEAASSRRQI